MPSTPAEDRVDGRDARWAEHRSSRRAELVRAARRAVHHRGPDLSMDDLAAEIGTSKSIIYRYFSDKSGLQGAVATRRPAAATWLRSASPSTPRPMDGATAWSPAGGRGRGSGALGPPAASVTHGFVRPSTPAEGDVPSHGRDGR